MQRIRHKEKLQMTPRFLIRAPNWVMVVFIEIGDTWGNAGVVSFEWRIMSLVRRILDLTCLLNNLLEMLNKQVDMWIQI